MVSVGNYWLHGEACYFFHFSRLCSQRAGSWAANRMLRFSMRSRSPETTTIIKVGSGFVLEAALLSVFRTFWKGVLEVKETGNENVTQTPASTRKNSCSFKSGIFSRYWCKQTTIQLYFLFSDVKCHNPSQSFKKCHDTHKNSQLCCWNNPGPCFSPKTLCCILHEKWLQMYVSEVLLSVNPGSCDIDGLTLVSFSSNWNKVNVCLKKKWFQENQCAFNNKGQILYCYMNMRRFMWVSVYVGCVKWSYSFV